MAKSTTNKDAITSAQPLIATLLQIAALLPRADKDLARRYDLSRKQMYLLYLAAEEGVAQRPLSYYAQLLNISNSTLTRNIEKLEARKILRRVKQRGSKTTSLQLLSHGQLYALEIGKLFAAHASTIDREQLNLLLRQLRQSSP